MKNEWLYIEHMLESTEKILFYTKDVEFEEFANSEMMQDAVIRQFQVIGQAARQLSRDMIAKLPEIEWPRIIGMRNKLVHEYFDVDLKAVWGTIREDLPALREQLKNAL